MKLAKVSDRLFPTFPSFMDNFFSRDLMDWNNWNFSSTNSTIPAVNIKENEESYVIEVAAPGMTKDNFTVSLEGDRLYISSEWKEEKDESGTNYSRREFSYQSFHRSFTIPQSTVDGDKISAKYTDGILQINLPKKEEVKPKPAKRIDIM
jgi:HSP20 family protein